MNRRTFLAAVAAAPLAGCTGGGGGDETPTPTESPTPRPTESPTPTPTATPEAPSARERYPDYEWSKLEKADPVPTETITMRGFEFHPLIAAVEPGTEVTVVNEDSSSHTFTVPKLRINESVGGGERTSVVVDRTGRFGYVCTLHPPGMLGRLVVTSDPPEATPTGTPTPTPTEDGYY